MNPYWCLNIESEYLVCKLKALYSGTLKALLAYQLEDQQQLAHTQYTNKKKVSSHTLIWKSRCDSRTRNKICQKKGKKIKNKKQQSLLAHLDLEEQLRLTHTLAALARQQLHVDLELTSATIKDPLY